MNGRVEILPCKYYNVLDIKSVDSILASRVVSYYQMRFIEVPDKNYRAVNDQSPNACDLKCLVCAHSRGSPRTILTFLKNLVGRYDKSKCKRHILPQAQH